MAEELVYKVGVEGTESLGKLEKSVKKTGETTNKTTSYMSQLRSELRDLRGEMIKNAQGTEAYNRALRRGAEITSQINDANSKMKIGVMDMGDTTKNVISTLTGFAGGFQVVQASMQLFGIENEEAIKSIMKLQQTMAIVQGMSAFAVGINDLQNMIANFRAESQLAQGAIGELGEVQNKTAEASSNLGKESAVLGSNLAGQTTIADKVADSNKNLIDSFKNLEKSVNNNKTEVNILGNSYDRLSKNQDILTDSLKDYEEQLINLWSIETPTEDEIEQIKKLELEYENLRKAYTTNRLELKKTGKLHTEKTKELRKEAEALEELGKTTDEGTKKTNLWTKIKEKFNKTTDEGTKATGDFTKSIVKSLATMGVFLLAIAAVSFGMAELIKWLNKIPEKVKIKLEIDENVQRDLNKERINIRKFANDYRKAWLDGDKGRIERLNEIGKKEYELSDDRLQMIQDSQDGWIEAFKQYLTVAEKTYEAESIMKRRIEAETDMKIAENKADQLFVAGGGEIEVNEETGEKTYKGKAGGFWEGKLSFEDLKKHARDKNWLTKNLADLIIMGVPQQIVDELRSALAAEEAIAVLKDLEKDIDYDGIDFGTGKYKGGTGGGLGATVETVDPLAKKKPDKVEKDIEIQFLKDKLLAKEELTNEELEMLLEYNRKSGKYTDDSLIKFSEFQVRLAKAREKDLADAKVKLSEDIKLKKEKFESDKENFNNELANNADAHNAELIQLGLFNQEKFNLEEEFGELSKKKDKTTGDKARLQVLRDEYEAVTNNIDKTKESVAEYKKKVKEIEGELKKLEATPEQIKTLESDLDKLNMAIAENSEFLATSLDENMRAMLDTATFYISSIGDAFNGLQNLTQGFMDAEDNKTAKLKNNLERSDEYRQADVEKQEQMMYELELANYESKKKAFELNKAFEIGAVVATGASNQMDIIANLLDPKNGGYLNPINIATAAASTVANLATTIGSIAQIKSSTLEEPVPPMGGQMAMGGGSVSLQPHKTALTSRDENLNMINNSNKDKPADNIVRVSDINKVQDNVKVRNNNSSY